MGDNVLVGYTRKPFGVKGQLKLQIETDYLEDIAQTELVFIEIRGEQVPYFIEEVQVGNDVVVKLEEVVSREDAAALGGKSVFLSSQDIIPEEDRKVVQSEETILKRYDGFMVEDEILGVIGKINRLEEFPQQIMAFVDYKESEVMIPLNENFITSLDEKERRIKMELPEGLLDL